jgi:hypothetical protein
LIEGKDVCKAASDIKSRTSHGGKNEFPPLGKRRDEALVHVNGFKQLAVALAREKDALFSPRTSLSILTASVCWLRD